MEFKNKLTNFKHYKIVISFLCLLLSIYTNAQQKVVGLIESINKIPLMGSTVTVIRFADAKEVKSVSTDSNGKFSITGLPISTFILKISCVGYNKTNTGLFAITIDTFEVNMGTITMSPKISELSEVTIIAKEKTLSQSNGTLTVNLGSSPTANGLSALEEIERLPGVGINRQNGTVSLKGKEGTTILINGIRTYMPTDALLQFLSSTAASKIAKIEIISNPSSSMDAEGSSGIINIVMKKNRQRGVSSSMEGQAGYGKGAIYNFIGDIGYNKTKMSSYFGYSFSKLAQEQISQNSRENTYSNQLFNINTFSTRFPIQRNHNIKYGIDYQVSDSSSIGVGLTFYDNKWSMNASNETLIFPTTYNKLKIVTQEINHWQHVGGNINFQHKFHQGRFIAANFDYLYYKDNNPSTYSTSQFDQNGTILSISSNTISKSTPIHIIAPQINYTLYKSKNMNVRIGIKSSISNFKNSVSDFGNPNSSFRIIDSSSLVERILASYGESDYKISNILTIVGGLRYEQTYSNLSANGLSNNIEKKYNNLFPNLSIIYQLRHNNTISFYYNKRINRPSFNDIAPFVLYLDPFTIFTGNPAIQPSIIHNFGTDYTIGKILLSTNYSYEKDVLAKFQINVDLVKNIQTIRPENLGNKHIFSFSIIAPITISTWWNIQNSVTTVWQHLSTGQFQNDRTLKQFSLQYSGTSQFIINSSIITEIAGFYNSKSLSGTSVIKSYGGLNLGLQIKCSTSSILRFNINDIFNSIKSTALIDTKEFHIKNGYDFSQRTIKISYAYKWGNNIKKNKTAVEEKSRVE